VARRILDLNRRHAAVVRNVFNNGIKANEAQIWNGRLPANCLISLVVGQGAADASYPAPSRATESAAAPVQQIRMSIDEVASASSLILGAKYAVPVLSCLSLW
jgi:hypothetical protein